MKTAAAVPALLAFCALSQPACAQQIPSGDTVLDACYAGKGSCDINLNGQRLALSRTLKINPDQVTLRNGIFECRMTSGTCLLISQDGFSPVSRPGVHRLEGITLYGTKSIDGITMDSEAKSYTTDAAMTLVSVSVQGFNHGLALGNNVWGIDMFNVLIGNGNVGIYTKPGTHNAGERSVFTGGTIYNNAVAGIDEESNWEFDFVGTSFDFNQQQMILRGPTSFTGHLENTDVGQPEIVLDALPGVPAGAIYMSAGSTITVDGWDAAHPKQPCYVKTALSYNNIKVPATMYGFGGKNGPVCGPGEVATWDGKALQAR